MLACGNVGLGSVPHPQRCRLLSVACRSSACRTLLLPPLSAGLDVWRHAVRHAARPQGGPGPGVHRCGRRRCGCCNSALKTASQTAGQLHGQLPERRPAHGANSSACSSECALVGCTPSASWRAAGRTGSRPPRWLCAPDAAVSSTALPAGLEQLSARVADVKARLQERIAQLMRRQEEMLGAQVGSFCGGVWCADGGAWLLGWLGEGCSVCVAWLIQRRGQRLLLLLLPAATAARLPVACSGHSLHCCSLLPSVQAEMKASLAGVGRDVEHTRGQVGQVGWLGADWCWWCFAARSSEPPEWLLTAWRCWCCWVRHDVDAAFNAGPFLRRSTPWLAMPSCYDQLFTNQSC